MSKDLMEKIQSIVQNGKGGKPCVFAGEVTFDGDPTTYTFQFCYISQKRVYKKLVKDTNFDETIFYYLRNKQDLMEAINGYCFFVLKDINVE